MNSLHQTIQTLAAEFAEGVLDVIKSGSLDDLLNGSSGARTVRRAVSASKVATVKTSKTSKGGRLARRSLEDIDAMAKSIVNIVRSAGKDGMRAEVIREKLGIDRKELPRPLAQALKAGWLKTTGQKRATTYFVKSHITARVGASAKPTKASKKTTKRAAKKGKRTAAKRAKRTAAKKG